MMPHTTEFSIEAKDPFQQGVELDQFVPKIHSATWGNYVVLLKIYFRVPNYEINCEKYELSHTFGKG